MEKERREKERKKENHIYIRKELPSACGDKLCHAAFQMSVYVRSIRTYMFSGKVC